MLIIEHPTGEHENAVDAIEAATTQLLAQRPWDQWVTFRAQGQGGRVDSYQFAELSVLGSQIDPGEAQLDVARALSDAGLSGRVEVSRSHGGHLEVSGATPREMSLLLDAIFRGQLGIRAHDDERDDYAIGAEC